MKVALSAAVGAVLILAAPTVASASSLNYYIEVTQAEVDFLQFTVSNTKVVGALYSDTLTGSAPSLTISTTEANMTGTDDGGRLTVYFSDSSTPFFGTVTGSSLSLEVPQSGGTLATIRLNRSSLGAYNQVLTRWHNEINHTNAAAAQAEAAAQARAQHQQQLLDNLNGAIATVDNDLSTMQSPGNLSDDLAQVDNDLAQVDNDLAQVSNDNSQLTNDNGSDHSTLCGDVSTEYQDAGVVVSDTHVMVNNAKSTTSPDLQQDQQAIGGAPADWAAYWVAQRALPTYHPTTAIPPLKVAIGDGQATIRQAVEHINGDIRQADSYIAQAYAMPNAAQKAMACGATQKVPVVPPVRWTRQP
jgi:hypothetical protein